MRNFFVGLFLAAFLPFIVGFGDMPPDKEEGISSLRFLKNPLNNMAWTICHLAFNDGIAAKIR
jgi:hypothetical protein